MKDFLSIGAVAIPSFLLLLPQYFSSVLCKTQRLRHHNNPAAHRQELDKLIKTLHDDADHLQQEKKRLHIGIPSYLMPQYYDENSDLRRLKAKNDLHNQNMVFSTRIVGGDEARRDEYPFFVEWDIGCAASVISENVLLTAAHCVTNSFWDANVWVGSHKTEEGIEARINGVSIHPKFNTTDKMDVSYDYAVLTIKTPIDPTILTPVQLNRDKNHPNTNDRDELTAIGLGLLEDMGQRSDKLQEVDLPFVSHDECAKIWMEEMGMFIDEESMLCAGGESGKDSCNGDSGGPILDQKGLQVGIVSFGSGCGDRGMPGVYSKITGALDWIDNFVCMNAVTQQKDNCKGRFPVQIAINHDNFPYEVSWGIKNATENAFGRSLLHVPSDLSMRDKGIVSRTVYLTPGDYIFQIEDIAGDGICCGFEGGNYKILTAGRTIERSGTFGYHDRVDFKITESGVLKNSVAPYNGTNNMIRIDIMYDIFPLENSWLLYNNELNKVAAASKRGSVIRPGLVSTYVEVPDGSYKLLLLDSASDGICCTFGRGSIEINKVIDSINDLELQSHRGEFEQLLELEFTLP